jgi:hypothetical protein
MMMAMRVLSFARCYLIHKKSISESKAQMFCFPCAQDEHLCKILSYAHKSHIWKESLDANFLAKCLGRNNQERSCCQFRSATRRRGGYEMGILLLLLHLL